MAPGLERFCGYKVSSDFSDTRGPRSRAVLRIYGHTADLRICLYFSATLNVTNSQLFFEVWFMTNSNPGANTNTNSKTVCFSIFSNPEAICYGGGEGVADRNSKRVSINTNSNLAAVHSTDPKRVCIMKNSEGRYLIINAAARGTESPATATGLGDAMAVAYRLVT